MGKPVDLTGQKFGRLTVLEDVGRSKDRKTQEEDLTINSNLSIVGDTQQRR